MQPSREKILDTAEALFARMGFAGVGLREIADRVGLRKSSLFHHFPTKADLYVAVLERVLLSIDLRLGGNVPSGEPLNQLERWLDEFVDALAENPNLAPLLLRTLFEEDVASPEAEAHLDRILDQTLGRVGRLLERGIRCGSIRRVSIPHTLQSLIGMTVYHFASGDFGERLLGASLYSRAEVRRRKHEIREFLRSGLRPAHP